GNQSTLPEGLAFGNGRIEADQIDISAKSAGRLRNVLVQEGDLVSAGQTLAQIDATELEAQRAKYLADETAEEASMLEAEALVAQREAEYKLREANLQRALALVDKAAVSIQSRDQAQSERDASRAALEAAKTNVIARERSIQAAKALVALIEAQIADATLKSPVKGRVLYRLAKTGEVVGAGGKVLTIIDLSEVYMEIYLPAQQAMQVPIGSEARIQFDRVDFAVPAIVSFVSPEAQFTPKQVETLDERNNLMFRVKLRVPQELVDKHIDQAKSGTRGVGYVRLGSNPPDWPEFLERRFPGETSEIEGQ
ncbi:MAG TPA: HlyD family efflux transporter periplasmic adaptor subunit, partial [Sinorhizobium sp.]|nr:HlyD family efflux transporter periplasmic adaptor subunit [Sinorhizobium sp.]